MNKSLVFAIIAGAVIPALIGAVYAAWPTPTPAVPEFDWGRNLSGRGVLNGVKSIEEFDAERGRFSYYTGARSGDVGRLTAAPTRVFAEASHGEVSVRLLGFEGYGRARADDEALEVARIVSSTTTRVFPATAIPVEIDVHFMPEGARFSLAKRVDWREGRPYELAVFTFERFVPATAAHELYHVLALRFALRKMPEVERRPNAANSFEEAAADLFAACGVLLANEPLARRAGSLRATIVDPDTGTRAEFEDALAGEELVAAQEIIANDRAGAGLFGYLLSHTVLDRVLGDDSEITLDSPKAAALLALCRETSPNPFALEDWLAGPMPPADGAPRAATD